MFTLAEITRMKLRQVKFLLKEIATTRYPTHRKACEIELDKTKYEAMHPHIIQDWLKTL